MKFGKHTRFVVRSEAPFNGGAPLDLLAAEAVTPTPLFYVRNHAAVPDVDRASYRLVVDGLVDRRLELGLDDLARLPRREVEAVMPCAGNRRLELIDVAPIPGELPWGSEAASNATWSGVALADVLTLAGPTGAGAHVAFEGLDVCERHGHRFGFGGSIPIDKAVSGEVLLADRMNGAPLEPVHGAPLRSVVPGYIGARSVKWISRITVRTEPSDNYFQRRAYRLLPPGAAPGAEEGPMLGEFPINVIVTAPAPETEPEAGPVEVAGVALVGGGRTVARVEVSGDGGASWTEATLERRGSRWSWTRFRALVGIAPGAGTIVARAWDDAGGGMADSAAVLWNAKGYQNNAWYRVKVTGRTARATGAR